jgi:hypothetical protein
MSPILPGRGFVMNIKKLTCWSARILGILYALFLSIFALDVFQEGYSASETIIALGMHLIPTAVVIILLLFAWKNARIGGLLFLILGAAFWVFFGGRNDWAGSLLVSGPLFLVGALFLVCSFLDQEPGG